MPKFRAQPTATTPAPRGPWMAPVVALLLVSGCEAKTPAEGSSTVGETASATPSSSSTEDGGLDPDLLDEGGPGGNSGAADNGGEFVSDDMLDGCDKIDFLFLVDNSRSMQAEQVNLQNSVPDFITAIDSRLDLEDYHLGVVSTDAYAENSPECSELGGLVVANGEGMACGPYADGHNYMTHNDDLHQSFVCAAELGIRGNDDERPMDAMQRAISGELSCNAGFIRDDALLVLILITDEEDDPEEQLSGEIWGSEGDPSSWYDAVLAAKGDKASNVAVLGLLGKDKPNSCIDGDKVNGAELSPRLLDFVARFGSNGRVGDVCAKKYGFFFESVLDLIEDACDDFLPPAR